VGGGVTGSTVAYLLARAGARVVLLEAGRIGQGSTAASTALLMQEPDTPYRELAVRFGPRAARHIWTAGRAAVSGLQRTLRALHVDAGFHQVRSVYVTRDAGELSELRREHQARRSARVSSRWLSPRVVRSLTGIEAAGAIETVGNAQVDPYRTCVGLAAAAERDGALLFERSTVRRMRGHARGLEIEVGRHRVRASWGVVATGYATPDFKPLAGRFSMVNTYVIATPPLSRGMRASLGLGDVMLWDSSEPYHYLRWTRDHRLLFGGADRPHHPRSRRDVLPDKVRALGRDLSGFYPDLAHIEPDYAWEGLFATTPDGLPYIGTHHRYPRHLFALGYGGNGMTFSFMAGGILQRIIEGRPRAEDAVFSFGRGRR
jgi:glycine/D-amino acid oxidase-like deaminating enzyme